MYPNTIWWILTSATDELLQIDNSKPLMINRFIITWKAVLAKWYLLSVIQSIHT